MNVRDKLLLSGVPVGLMFVFFAAGSAWAVDLKEGVEQLAGQLTTSVPEGKQLRLAVTDFPDLQGVTSDLGRFIAERLTTRLSQNPKFFVIERRRLGQVLGELKFSMSDLVDPNKAKQLGRMLGVEALVVGSLSDLGNIVDVDARIIEIETNRMMPGASTTISRDQVVSQMLERGRAITTPPAPAAPPAVAAAPPPAERLRGLQYVHRLFSFELSDVEVLGEEVKLTFLYTNKTESPQHGYIASNDTYLVDNAGNRYTYTGDSFGRQATFPPQIPERVWVSFRKLQAPRSQGVQAPRSLAGARPEVQAPRGTEARGGGVNVMLRSIPCEGCRDIQPGATSLNLVLAWSLRW